MMQSTRIQANDEYMELEERPVVQKAGSEIDVPGSDVSTEPGGIVTGSKGDLHILDGPRICLESMI